MSIWTWFKNWILPLILNFHVNKAEMQQIIIENKQKLSCYRQQNQKKCEYSTRSQFKNSIRPNSAEKNWDFNFFLKILYKQLFWLVGPVGKNLLNLSATINLSRHSLKEPLCKISAKSDKYFRSYAVFLNFWVVGWLGWLGWLDVSQMHQMLCS